MRIFPLFTGNKKNSVTMSLSVHPAPGAGVQRNIVFEPSKENQDLPNKIRRYQTKAINRGLASALTSGWFYVFNPKCFTVVVICFHSSLFGLVYFYFPLQVLSSKVESLMLKSDCTILLSQARPWNQWSQLVPQPVFSRHLQTLPQFWWNQWWICR